MKLIEKSSKKNFIDLSMYSPKTKEGKTKTIGVWDDDGEYRYFKTLGAKRYIYLGWDNKHHKWKWNLTVAGLHKQYGMDYIRSLYRAKRWRERAHFAAQGIQGVSQLTIMDVFSEFSENLLVPAEYSGRLTHTYCDAPASGYVTDYQGKRGYFEELSYIHMEPSSYDLTISDSYDLFLDFLLGEQEIYND